jgi:hypothetical protein
MKRLNATEDPDEYNTLHANVVDLLNKHCMAISEYGAALDLINVDELARLLFITSKLTEERAKEIIEDALKLQQEYHRVSLEDVQTTRKALRTFEWEMENWLRIKAEMELQSQESQE